MTFVLNLFFKLSFCHCHRCTEDLPTPGTFLVAWDVGFLGSTPPNKTRDKLQLSFTGITLTPSSFASSPPGFEVDGSADIIIFGSVWDLQPNLDQFLLWPPNFCIMNRWQFPTSCIRSENEWNIYHRYMMKGTLKTRSASQCNKSLGGKIASETSYASCFDVIFLFLALAILPMQKKSKKTLKDI